VGDDVSSDAIICHHPVAPGDSHVRDPAPPGRRRLAGTESAISLFDVAVIDPARFVAVSSSKVAEPASIVSAGSL
jgi:hypothetical protein